MHIVSVTNPFRSEEFGGCSLLEWCLHFSEASTGCVRPSKELRKGFRTTHRPGASDGSLQWQDSEVIWRNVDGLDS